MTRYYCTYAYTYDVGYTRYMLAQESYRVEKNIRKYSCDLCAQSRHVVTIRCSFTATSPMLTIDLESRSQMRTCCV